MNYERNQRIHMLGKTTMLRAVVDVLPFPRTWQGQVLEIGAGQGALSQVLLRRYPRCHLTLLDGSPEMLEVAQDKLALFADRTRFIVADFNTSTWPKTLTPPYDAIITSLALHYLEPKRRPAFFRAIYRFLPAEGWFIDASRFDNECDALSKRSEEIHARYAQRQMHRLANQRVSLDDLIARRAECSRLKGHHRTTVQGELAQLLNAGFTGAECIWRCWTIAVIAAYKV